MNKKVVFITTSKDDFVIEVKGLDELKSGKWIRIEDKVARVFYASSPQGMTIHLGELTGRDQANNKIYRKYLDLNTARIIAMRELDSAGDLYRQFVKAVTGIVMATGKSMASDISKMTQ